MLAERGADDVPGGEQVTAVTGGDIDRGLQHVGQGGARRGQRFGQVRHDLLGLARHVASADHILVLVERAGTRGEDQSAGFGDRGVGVRDAAVQPVGTDKLHSHRARMSCPKPMRAGSARLVAPAACDLVPGSRVPAECCLLAAAGPRRR